MALAVCGQTSRSQWCVCTYVCCCVLKQLQKVRRIHKTITHHDLAMKYYKINKNNVPISPWFSTISFFYNIFILHFHISLKICWVMGEKLIVYNGSEESHIS